MSGRNFLTESIHRTVKAWIAEGGRVEPFRCRHNMPSSQPMCFNLFGPLVDRPDLAAAFVSTVTGRTVEVEPGGVIIEDSPGHLGDRTDLDASIRYITSDGEAGVLSIETKLTEEFSPKVYPLDWAPPTSSAAAVRSRSGNCASSRSRVTWGPGGRRVPPEGRGRRDVVLHGEPWVVRSVRLRATRRAGWCRRPGAG